MKMKRYQLLGIIATILLFTLLLACGKPPSLPSKQPKSNSLSPSQNHDVELLMLNEEDVTKITIISRAGDNIGVVEERADINELVEIVNEAPSVSGPGTADDYGVFTFYLKDESKISLGFGGHGSYYSKQGYSFTINEEKVKRLNTLVDRIKK